MRSTIAVALALAAGAHGVAVESEHPAHVFGKGGAGVYRGPPSATGAPPPPRLGKDGAGVLKRSELVAGDFFESVPGGADLYLLKSVLHDWADEPAVQILRRCRDALTRDGARLLVIERVLPDRMQSSAEHQDLARSDLTMLLAHGAGERRLADFERLFDAAGLCLERVRPLGLTMSVLVISFIVCTRLWPALLGPPEPVRKPG